MLRGRLGAYRERIRTEFRAVFAEHHTPTEIAGSFAFGIFVTTLPTFGVGILVFIVIAYRFDRVSKLALFASILILNPIAKWGVYAVSFWLGTHLLGPAPGVSPSGVTLAAGPDIAVRVLVGTLILAVSFAAIGYVVVYRVVIEYRRRELELVDVVVDELTD